jgi:hypothetical protein
MVQGFMDTVCARLMRESREVYRAGSQEGRWAFRHPHANSSIVFVSENAATQATPFDSGCRSPPQCGSQSFGLETASSTTDGTLTDAELVAGWRFAVAFALPMPAASAANAANTATAHDRACRGSMTFS